MLPLVGGVGYITALGVIVGVFSHPRKSPGAVLSSLSSLGSVIMEHCSEGGCICPWIRAVC